MRIAVWGLLSGLKSRRHLAFENPALRQQLMVLRRQKTKVNLKDRDRVFWIWLQRVWPGWRRAFVLVSSASTAGAFGLTGAGRAGPKEVDHGLIHRVDA